MFSKKTLQLAQGLIPGIQKRSANVQQLTFGGFTYAPADLVKAFQAFLDAAAAAATLRVQYLSGAKAAGEAEVKVHALILAFRAYVRAYFGKDPASLQDFGLTPRPSPKPKTSTKAAAVAKAAATRKVLHTMGKQQKKDAKKQAANPPAPPAPSVSPSPKVGTGA